MNHVILILSKTYFPKEYPVYRRKWGAAERRRLEPRGKRRVCDPWQACSLQTFLHFLTALIENDPTKAGPVDPLAQVEKMAESSKRVREVGAPRIEALYELSDTYNADPYELSKRVRKHFRKEKKVEKRKRAEEDGVKDKYALPSTLKLVDETEVKEEAKIAWAEERPAWEAQERSKRRRTVAELGRNTSSGSTLPAVLLTNTLKRGDPFLLSQPQSIAKPTISGVIRKPRG